MYTFTSKRSPRIYGALFVIWLSVLSIMIGKDRREMILLLLLVAAYIFFITVTTRYQVIDNVLHIRRGFMRKKIRVDTIRELKETNSAISAGASSADRIEIIYNENKTVVISPAEKEKFIRLITAFNPAIVVKRIGPRVH